MLINSPPEVVQLAADADEYFIQKSFVAGLRPTALQGLGVGPSEAQAPFPDGFVADRDASCRKDQLDFTQAQAEAVLQPGRLVDDFSRETVAAVRIGRRGHAQDPAIDIGKSDALYHNVEHTFLVTLVGRDILHGRMLAERLEPDDYTHLITACLLHDIGYVRGVLKGDGRDRFVVDASGATVTLPRGASDAALTPHHVDRSKLFVMERLADSPLLDAERVARAVEFTRFPAQDTSTSRQEDREGRLVQAADLIGQLGDPLYLKKANALFNEFEEIGVNCQLGYNSPADMVERFPDFYWSSVSPHLQEATTYLNVTAAGRQWIANLHNHVFCAQHDFACMGPQR